MSVQQPVARRRKSFPKVFWIANSMDIFERFAWFGFFAVSGIYMTDSVANGGLGFTHIERGTIQAIMPFLLYLMPVITGALSDRYGYRKMFLIAFIVLIPSYYFLGQVHEFWSFFMVFFLVAVGAAIYKPLVVATIGHVTDESNRGVAFGINYTLVNLGATVGIFVAGIVRSISWDMVFIMSAAWLSLNFIPLYFFKEPTTEANSEVRRNLKQVLLDAREVLGNGRFALMVVPIIMALMAAGSEMISWKSFGIFLVVVIMVNVVWDAFAEKKKEASWYRQKTRIGNWPFVLYLLVLAGFWTMYNQLFLTMPLYIQDFIDTSSMVHGFKHVAFLGSVTTADVSAVSAKLAELAAHYPGGIDESQASAVMAALLEQGIRVPHAEILNAFQSINSAAHPQTIEWIAQAWVNNHAQINPEFLLSINFISIVLFQIMVSLFIDRFDVIKVLVAGCLLCSFAWLLGGFAHYFAFAGILVMLTILIFSFGEMVTSPKSTEYVATVAPKNKVCMFMGYYFVCIALGNLFGGLVSGWSYQIFAKDMNKPELMWLLFGCIGIATAVVLIIFNLTVVHRLVQQQKDVAGKSDDKAELATA